MSISVLVNRKIDQSVRKVNINVSLLFLGSDVRSKAFQAVDQFLQILKNFHEKVCYQFFLSW